MNKKKFKVNFIAFYYLIIPVIILILTAIPYGVVVHVSSHVGEQGDAEIVSAFCSYFDLLAFRNGIFSPFLIAITTCLTIALLLAYAIFNKKPILYVALFLIFAMIIMTIMQMIVVFYSLHVISWFILLLYIGEVILIFLSQKRFIA